jgi:hypothetical protein
LVYSTDLSPILLVSDHTDEQRTYQFPVESEVTYLRLEVVGFGCGISFEAPDHEVGGSSVQFTDTYPGYIIMIEDPIPGWWSVSVYSTVDAADFDLRVTGSGSIELTDFHFVESTGRPGHGGYFAIDDEAHPPMYGDIGAVGQLYGNIGPGKVEFVAMDRAYLGVFGPYADDGLNLGMEPGSRADGEPDSQTFFGVGELSFRPFYVFANGTDANGNVWQRVVDKLYIPSYEDKTYHVGNLDSIPGVLAPASATLSPAGISANHTSSTSSKWASWANTTRTVAPSVVTAQANRTAVSYVCCSVFDLWSIANKTTGY